MTLYLKYRPKNLDELDLFSVSESLKKIVNSGNIPHAFLFAGPKGTGKTSAARILAKIINCLAKPDPALQDRGIPCNKCAQCLSISKGSNLDVIEIDAASHRGIDDIRILRDAVKLTPGEARKKIYIIDEAHMLTTEASNALLKTLEEPPDHVVFILATTNPEKLIETIKSRTTLIPFVRASIPETVRSLRRVADGEGIKIKDDALESIAEFANGAFRDAIKILEQATGEGIELTRDGLEKIFFRGSFFDADSFMKNLIKKDKEKLLINLEDAGKKGVSPETLLQKLFSEFHRELLAKSGIGKEVWGDLSEQDLIMLTEIFTAAGRMIPDSPIEILPLEIAVVKYCGSNRNRESEIKNQEEKPTIPDSDPQIHDVAPDSQFKSPDSTDKVVMPAKDISFELIEDGVWKDILAKIRPINASIEALLRAAKPVGYDGKTLTLGVYYKFHKERLEEDSHRRVLEDVVAKILNSPVRIICILTEPPAKKIMGEAVKETVLTEGEDKDIVEIAEKIFSN